jgi:hypothetical protein
MNFSRLVVIVDLAGREARRRMRHFGGSTPAAKHSNILRTADMKLIRKNALLTLALVLGIAAPAAAQQTGRDARCLLVSSIFSTSANDEKARQAADTTRAFFLGGWMAVSAPRRSRPPSQPSEPISPKRLSHPR